MIARLVLGLAAALTLAGCGAAEPGGGLFGTVYVSPATPVCRAGTSCTRPARRFRLVFTRGDHQSVATTDRRGRYRVELSGGSYTLPEHVAPHRIVVGGDGFRPRDFTYDPGIR